MRFKIYQISNESSRVFLDQLNDVIDKSFVGVQSTSLTFALSVTWHTEDSSCMDTSMCQVIICSFYLYPILLLFFELFYYSNILRSRRYYNHLIFFQIMQNTNSSLVLATDGQLTFAMISLEFSEVPLNFIYQVRIAYTVSFVYYGCIVIMMILCRLGNIMIS